MDFFYLYNLISFMMALENDDSTINVSSHDKTLSLLRLFRAKCGDFHNNNIFVRRVRAA